MRINYAAPTESLVVDVAGNVGIVTNAPAVSFVIRRTDGTAKIKVDERSESEGTRIFFILKNMGLTKFVINNTAGA